MIKVRFLIALCLLFTGANCESCFVKARSVVVIVFLFSLTRAMQISKCCTFIIDKKAPERQFKQLLPLYCVEKDFILFKSLKGEHGPREKGVLDL